MTAEHEWQLDRSTVCDGHDPEGNVLVRQLHP